MKHFLRGCTTLIVLLSAAGCSNFYRNVEAPYMRPGALDSPVPTNFDEYRVRFLDRYRIAHAWPVTSNCQYGKLPTKYYKEGEISYGNEYIVNDIYEDGQSTKQREAHPAWNLDRYVRSDKSREPVYETVNGVRSIARHEEKEHGFKPVCFQYWAGTSHSLTMRLYKSSIEDRIAHYSRKPGSHSKEKIGDQTWWVWHYPFGEGTPNAYGGEAWALPIGETDYTLSLELGSNQDSLKNPQAHAKMQAMFRRLLESVKVDPLTPAIEAEIAQLKARAIEVQRQECIEMAKRTKPFTWCQKYLPQ